MKSIHRGLNGDPDRSRSDGRIQIYVWIIIAAIMLIGNIHHFTAYLL